MALEGETMATGAPKTCPECGVTLELKVMWSPAGYYVGTQCSCGPYSRESGYYRKPEDADLALKTGDFGR